MSANQIDSDKRFELCLKEIDVVQSVIARFDQNGIAIKSWGLTTWSAVIAYGLQNRRLSIVLLGIAVIFGFGITELTYRRYQRRFLRRASELEDTLKSGDLTQYQYSVNLAATSINVRAEMKFALSQPHFTLFYLMLLIFTCGCSIYLLLT
jgi:hypothetical protein